MTEGQGLGLAVKPVTYANITGAEPIWTNTDNTGVKAGRKNNPRLKSVMQTFHIT